MVRFGIRNCEIDVKQNPQAIYGLLRKHFWSHQCSPVPLAEFYSTWPRENEDPFEYWLRLNGAADVAVSHLKENGKTFDNPSVEVTCMFISNCPSKEPSQSDPKQFTSCLCQDPAEGAVFTFSCRCCEPI